VWHEYGDGLEPSSRTQVFDAIELWVFSFLSLPTARRQSTRGWDVTEQLDGEELIAPPPLSRTEVASPFVLPSAIRDIAAPKRKDLWPLIPLENHPEPRKMPLVHGGIEKGTQLSGEGDVLFPLPKFPRAIGGGARVVALSILWLLMAAAVVCIHGDGSGSDDGWHESGRLHFGSLVVGSWSALVVSLTILFNVWFWGVVDLGFERLEFGIELCLGKFDFRKWSGTS
jgi:hypothetical protein